jgi:catechol 2,3-dioxygenase-like lactoylglutathione lyase family enzyme
MLGSFLELGVATPRIQDSFAFYQRLGFGSALVNDIWSHPYGVLVSGALALGLHAALERSPALTFVKPDVAQLGRQLELRGIELTTRRVGFDSFNEIGFDDAAGLAVRVLEARTFSPPADLAAEPGPAGRFERLSIPARDPEAALQFWRELDCLIWEPQDEDWPRPAVAFGSLQLSFHERALAPEPLLVFGTTSLAASLARLEAPALPPRAARLNIPGAGHAVIAAPEGSLLLLREVPQQR